MKTLYIECNMGAAGDMLMAALLELHPAPEAVLERLNQMGLPGVQIKREPAEKCGIQGTHISVRIHGEAEESEDVPHGHGAHSAPGDGHEHIHRHVHHHEHEHHPAHSHAHASMEHISHLLSHLQVPDSVRKNAAAVYAILAQAESRAHGVPAEQIHFHEVGDLDAVADIVGVCLLMEELAVDNVFVSPIHVGSGQVKCAHGILPVPAPATAHILQGIPSYGGSVQGELCTPTGAALLKHFATEFGGQPVMTVSKIGYGMGKKEFPAANCVRAFLGETPQATGAVVELSCNLDDMTGEELGFVQGILLKNGALDVYMVPIQMKKNRPGILLCCICKPELQETLAKRLLEHTTTFGVRYTSYRRYCLDRSVAQQETVFGTVRIKTGTGFGVSKSKMEYADLSAIASREGISISQVRKRIAEQGE